MTTTARKGAAGHGRQSVFLSASADTEAIATIQDVKSDEGTVLRSERYYGRLYRSFSLQQKIDQAKAQAKYADGVLELKLPKASSDSARKKRLEVH